MYSRWGQPVPSEVKECAIIDVGHGGRASCIVAVDDTGGGVDIIHSTKGKSVISSIYTMGGGDAHLSIAIVDDDDGATKCP